MKLHKIDFAKLSIEYAKVYGQPYTRTQLKGFFEKSKDSSKLKKNIISIIHNSKGKVRKEYLTIDYKALSMAVLEKYGPVYSPSYLKSVHTGNSSSIKVLNMIKDVLGEGE